MVKEWTQIDGEWVRLCVDVRGEPAYWAEDSDGTDVSLEVLGGNYRGEAFPWMTLSGPVIPYIFYRPAVTGWFWDAFSGIEVVEGTLQACVYFSYFGHVLRNTAWKARYAIGLQPAGLNIDETGKVQDAVTDPAVLMLLEKIQDFDGQPTVGSFDQPIEPDRLINSIILFERRVKDQALSGVTVTRTTSDVRSAMSLAVSREEQRAAQRAYEPVFRRSDLVLIRTVAALMGHETTGWEISYVAIPRDPAEVKAEWDMILQAVESGLMSRAEAYQRLHPGLTLSEAEDAVANIEKELKNE